MIPIDLLDILQPLDREQRAQVIAALPFDPGRPGRDFEILAELERRDAMVAAWQAAVGMLS